MFPFIKRSIPIISIAFICAGCASEHKPLEKREKPMVSAITKQIQPVKKRRMLSGSSDDIPMSEALNRDDDKFEHHRYLANKQDGFFRAIGKEDEWDSFKKKLPWNKEE
jgi:hypothetical protein